MVMIKSKKTPVDVELPVIQGRYQDLQDKGVDNAIAAIRKEFGKSSVFYMGDASWYAHQVPVIPTGSLLVDNALMIGGLPKGRIIEIYGPQAGGKTTLSLSAIARCQKRGELAAFIDAEHALDITLAQSVGADTDKLLISQPDYGEQGLDILNMLVASRAFGIVVVDSVAALVPKAELEGDMEQNRMGEQARMMGRGMRKLAGVISKTNTCVIFINQLRHKLGITFGSPETTPGGEALKFYSSIRIDIRRIGAVKVADEIIGNRVKVMVVKNKLAPPFKVVETDLIFGKGFIKEAELFDLCLAAEMIEQSGSWFSCGPDRIGLGRQEAIKTLQGNEPLCAKLEKDLIESQKLSGMLQMSIKKKAKKEPKKNKHNKSQKSSDDDIHEV